MGGDIQMKHAILVCPPDTALLKATKDYPVVLSVGSLSSITEAFHRAGGNRVHKIHVEVKGNLSDIPLQEEWKDLPIDLFMEGMGPLTELAPRLPFFRRARTVVYLPSSNKATYASLQVLASLGVPCGLWLQASIHWENFNNLMHYALFPKFPHAPVEPFEYIRSSYNPESIVSLDHVYYKDDTTFIPLKKNEDIRDFESVTEENRKTQASRLRRFMQNNDKCATCKAWRICLGKMLPYDATGKKCSSVMSELFDSVAEVYQLKHSGEPCQR